jgi:hypothetical protein
MSSELDAELYGAGIIVTCAVLERGERDFVSVAKAVSRELDHPPVALRRFLRSWYEGARYACLDHGLNMAGCSTEDEILDAMVDIDEWGGPQAALPEPLAWLVSGDPAQAPSQGELRAMLTGALSTPTPEGVMQFARSAVRHKAYGPFNIYMIHTQRPGAGAVASSQAWHRLGRTVRKGAIPILILKPLGPITQVFEELDTEPQPQREPETDAFAATGKFDPARLATLIERLGKRTKRHLVVRTFPATLGSNLAGWITGSVEPQSSVSPRVSKAEMAANGGKESVWDVTINAQLTPAEQFVTLLHELGHLFCGHLGPFLDSNHAEDEFGWPDRRTLNRVTQEIEAELVAWWLAEREGIVTGSPLYLKPYLECAGDAVAHVDFDRVTRAVARVRGYLGGKP